MIDEAIGKILGMAMAYAVSALGLFLAYVNYRKRTVRATNIMTPAAWGVVLAIVVVIAAGVGVVAQLAHSPDPAAAPVEQQAEIHDAMATTPIVGTAAETTRDSWPVIGIVIPAVILLFATWVTSALYVHFAKQTAHP